MFDYNESRNSYKASEISYYTAVASRQRAKDEQFIEIIDKFFRKGSVLEIGAGIGQLSELLQNRGYDVTSSDVQPFFIDCMKSKGLKSLFVDALDISHYVDQKFDNILAQGISPLITTDLSIVEKVYNSVFHALSDSGRFIFIFPNAYGNPKFSKAENHLNIINSVGFSVIYLFRHQVMPSSYYAKLDRNIVNFIELSIGKFLGIRYVIILEK